LINSILFAVQATVPATPEWSPAVGLVMILCNAFAFVIGRYAIQNPGKGPALPGSNAAILKGFGIPELLATTSLGHIIGVGVILGLSNAGAL
jgi:photosystem I subunit X